MTIAQDIEIQQLKDRIESLEDNKLVLPFVNELLEQVGILLANTPFDKWSQEAKTAYYSASSKMPIAAHIYRQRLP